MPGEHHAARIELHNANGPPAPKPRSRIADSDGRQLLPTWFFSPPNSRT